MTAKVGNKKKHWHLIGRPVSQNPTERASYLTAEKYFEY